MKTTYVALFLLILCLAVFTRFFGVNWDQNTHLHPDERFLTMVAVNLVWPQNLQQYFDTDTSLLNPHNRGFGFFVYGTWPVILAKAVAAAVGRDTYDGFPLVGRSLAAIADLLTVVFVFLLAKRLLKGTQSALLAAALYTMSVLPIQLSHFFTVDPFATLLLTISLYLIATNNTGIPLGIAVGLAISAKISSALFLPIAGIFFLSRFPWKKPLQHGTDLIRWLTSVILFTASLFITVRVTYPYLFHGWLLNPLLLANWRELSSFDTPQTTFPPALQWIGVSPLQPILDLFVWGLGIPLGILAALSIIYYLSHTLRVMVKQKRFTTEDHGIVLLLSWILLIVGYQSIQFAKAMRYMYPIYPALAVLSSMMLNHLIHLVTRRWRVFIIALFYIVLLLWPLAFMSIYRSPHTRIAASTWIYQHVPAGASIAWEHWDDPLPLTLGNKTINVYRTQQMPMYDQETSEKWHKITTILSDTEYIVLSSNRVYGGIGRAATRLPQTNRYYELLFSEKLGFAKEVEFVSRPSIPFFRPFCLRPPGFFYSSIHDASCNTPGIQFIDDYAEESFTVYDHPKVTIFHNIKWLTASELYTLIYE